MVTDNEYTLAHIAEYYKLSYSRVRGIVRDLNIQPKRYEGNQPIFSKASVLRIEKRNVKPGPKVKK